ncbi:MAG TPA: MarR family transcriptional regulator [Ktedonobacterales bacterium]|jgi:DNA-binding MarR family transcriptional regulator
MQQMQHAANELAEESVEALAAALMDVAPLVVREIRAQMRTHRGAGLSIPQFRALAFVRRHPACSLTAVAEHLGLSEAATSRLVDALVAAGFIVREPLASDRRFVALRLSEQGERIQAAARAAALSNIVARLAPLSVEQREVIARAMNPLRQAFASGSASAADDASVGPQAPPA